MLEPEEVSAMLRLKELGWGAKRIGQELGVSRNTVKDYIVAGGWTPYRQPERKKALDGLEDCLRRGLKTTLTNKLTFEHVRQYQLGLSTAGSGRRRQPECARCGFFYKTTSA